MHNLSAAGNIQSRSRAAHAYEAARQSRNLNIARSAGPKQILRFTRLQKSSFWAIFLVLSIWKFATAIISIPQFENANEINFQNQISAIFSNFQKFPIFSCLWVRPESRSIFSPEIFQKLRLAKSESTYPTVGLDKRKSQTNIRLSSTEPKRKKSEPKKSHQDSANLAPATLEQYYFTSKF